MRMLLLLALLLLLLLLLALLLLQLQQSLALAARGVHRVRLRGSRLDLIRFFHARSLAASFMRNAFDLI